MDGSARLDYRIELYNPGSVGVDYQVRLGRVLSPALTSFIPVVLLSIAVANAGWALYLNPIRKKHSASSIFGPDHVEEVGAGERTYSEYARQPSIVSQTSPASYLHPQAPAHATPLGSFSLPPPSHAPRQAGGGSPSHVEGGGSDGGSHQGPRRDSQLRRTRSEPGPGADAKDVTALLEHATASLRANRRGEAVAAIERVLALDPRNATALAGLAEIYEADGRWEEAGATWARYEKIQTEEPEARLRHADALLKAGNRQGALRVLEEARAGFPEDGRIRVRFEELHVDVPGLLSKALVSSASGRLPEAIALLDRILVQEPDNINALVSKGIALRRSGRGAEALSLFDAALQRQPSNAAALHAKGALLEEQGAFEAALAAYEDLHEANPRNPEAWVLQAAVLAKLGRPEEALAAYREAILLEPGNVENQDKLRALESSMGSEEKFMEELFRVPGMEPARVRSLIDAGYRTADSIRRATEDELANVDGMTRTFARDLRLHFHAGTSRR
jgi:tetratricopeptide (TPR) repeat protein